MKIKSGKWLAFLLAAALTVTMVPSAAFADTANTQSTESEEQTMQESSEEAADLSEEENEEVTDPSEENSEEVTASSKEDGEEVTASSEEESEKASASSEEENEGAASSPEEISELESNAAMPMLAAPAMQTAAAKSSDVQTETSVAKVGDTYYDTLAQAFNAAGTEGTIELVADAELSTRILVAAGRNITLDLGEYTVKSDGGFFDGYSMVIENRGTLTVTGDGTIEAVTGTNPYIGIENSGGTLNVISGNVAGNGYGIRNTKGGSLNISGGVVSNKTTARDGQDCAVYAGTGTTVISGNAVLNGYSAAIRSYGGDVTVSGNAYLDGQFGVMLFNSPSGNEPDSTHSKFTMTGGEVNAKWGLALAGNNTQSALCSAEITGGTLKAVDEATAIYWPMEGTLTVGGSAVVEGGTGIEAKMGTINITGGTITGTGAYLADEPYSGGSQSEGSALLVASQMYGEASGQYITSPELKVSITGGNLSGNQGNAVTVYNTEKTEAQSTNVAVSGGVFNAASERTDIYVVNASGALAQENGVNSVVSSQSETSVSVSSNVAAAAVDSAGNVSYYTDVNEALAANTQGAEPAEIYVMANGQISSEALESENVKLITASGVELKVESNIEGMIVNEVTNDDGSKTYELVDASDYYMASVNGTYYETLAEAFEKAPEGASIVLLNDTAENSVINVDKSLTLVLNGHVITNNVSKERLFNVTGASFTVDATVEGSAMTIPESNADSYGFVKISEKSVVTLNGGTYSGKTDNGAFVKIIKNDLSDASGSSVILKNVSMTSNNRFFDTNTLTTPAETPTLQVEGGTYVTDGMAFSTDTIALSPVTFDGVSVTAGNGPGIELCGSAGTFTDCDFKVTNSTNPTHFSAAAVSVSYGGTAVVNSGTYESTGYGAYVYSSGGTITVKDGTISGNVAAVRADVDSKTYPDAKASVVVEGGNTVGAWQTNGNVNATLTAAGGTHSVNVNEYAEDGFRAVEDENGNYVIQSADNVYLSGTDGNDANNGIDKDNAVKTLEKALKMVAEGGTIYICGAVTVDSSLAVDGVKIERAEGFTGTLITVTGTGTELTLKGTELDGKNVADTTGYLINITDGAVLNIEEGTKLTNNNQTAVFINNNSTLNMNGGEISGNTVSNDYGMGGGVLNYGTANLNGGDIKGNTAAWGGGIMAFGGSSTVLDGASISGNTATAYGGGGVYLYGDGTEASFELKSGSIYKNTAEYGTGAGIFAHYATGDVTVRISGGIIKENTCEAEELGDAIGIYGVDGSTAYPRIELSGSPEIRGNVLYQNDYEDGYVMYVTGAFTPVVPIEIDSSNSSHGMPAVEYEEGLRPSTDDFVSSTIFLGLKVEGQKLIWVDAEFVYFYDEDGTEYKENRHGVITGETIDIEDIPAPEKTGYTLDGWYEKGSSEPWDFANDTVEGTTKLYARWSLNAPSVTVTADDLTPHIGTNAILTAVPAHELDSVDYAYQWYKDGTPVQGETKNTLTVSENGNYTVKVKASDGTIESSDTESAPSAITVEDHKYTDTVTASTCTQQGYTTHTCSVCGDSYIDSYTAPAGHSFGEWMQVTSPTCENKGSEKRVCSECGYTETRETDAAGHDWEAEYTVDKAATCTQDGSQSIHCKNCDAVKDSKVIPATGHRFEWVIDKEATATEAGLKHEECTVCGYAKDAVEIPAKGEEGGETTTTPEPTDKPQKPEKPSGTDSTKTEGKGSPETGDSSNATFWVVIMAAAAAALAGTYGYSRRKK
jgi:uncharacterized repeat protein (TIGR02543 family)